MADGPGAFRGGIFSGVYVFDVRYCAGIVMLRNIAFYFFL
jgi:hypothetical protein